MLILHHSHEIFKYSFYYVRFSILGKIIVESYRQFHWRVWLVSVFFIFMYFLHQLLSLLFRVVDEIFHRNHRKVKITQPVFIISNPRSGTTYLHRLIALDDERFTYTKFAHTFFMTSSFVQLYYVVRWADRKIFNRLGSKIMNALDDTFGEDGMIFIAWVLIKPKKMNWFPAINEHGGNDSLSLFR